MVQSYALDTEAFAVGEQIIATLKAMGAIVADDRATFIGTGGMESGIHVRNQDKSELNFAFCLTTNLKVIGGLQTFLNDPQPKYGSVSGGGGQAIKPGVPFVWVMIGVKPLPLIDKKNSKLTK